MRVQFGLMPFPSVRPVVLLSVMMVLMVRLPAVAAKSIDDGPNVAGAASLRSLDGGVASFRVHHVWRGPYVRTLAAPMTADAFGNPLQTNALYQVERGPDGAARATPLDEVADFTVRVYEEAGAWILLLLCLRVLSFFALRAAPTPLGMIAGLTAGVAAAGWVQAALTAAADAVQPWMLAITPALLLACACVGALASAAVPRPIAHAPQWLPAALVTAAAATLWYAVDPFRLLGYAMAVIIVAAAMRRGARNGFALLLMSGMLGIVSAGVALALP